MAAFDIEKQKISRAEKDSASVENTDARSTSARKASPTPVRATGEWIMDINLASLAGNLNAPKRHAGHEEAVAPKPSRNSRTRRMIAAMSVLLAVVGL